MPLVLTQSGTLVWRQYNTDGVSGSGNHQPVQADIVVWARELEARVTNGLNFSVKDRDLVTPPGSPAVGDRYILGSGALGGAWSAFSNDDIVEWNGSAWLRETPSKERRAWVDDEDRAVVFDGTDWQTGALLWFKTVTDFGAAGDGQFVSDAVITAADNTVTSASALFVSSDVGKVICIGDAKVIRTATVTITIASPGVITDTGHTYSDGQKIVLSTTGALPTGLTAGTIYFVKSAAANTYRLSATQNGTAINTTGSQSGVHTAKAIDYLETTISAFNSTSSVEVTVAPTNTATGRAVMWGTDSTDAFNDAIASLTLGGVLFVPPGIYLASSIDITETGCITLSGAPWGVNNFTQTQSGSVICPINGNFPLIDTIGSVGLTIKDIQLGSTNNPVTGRVAVLWAHSNARFSDGQDMEKVYVTGKWGFPAIYCYAVSIVINRCRIWNYDGRGAGFALICNRTNNYALTSNYATISTADGNAANKCYNSEFHDFFGGPTLGGSIYLRGCLGFHIENCGIDSSTLNNANILAEQTSGVNCTMTAVGNTFYSESATNPLFSYACGTTLTLGAWQNTYTFSSAKKGGGGSFVFTTPETV